MQDSKEHAADTLIRQAVAEAEMSELAGMLMNNGWAVDLHTFPGTLSAAKGAGRVFYPAGAGGRWDTAISQMRPVDGMNPVDLADADREVLAWQVRLTQSTPLDVVVAIAALTTGNTSPPVSPLAEVEDFFRTDDLEGEGDDPLPC